MLQAIHCYMQTSLFLIALKMLHTFTMFFFHMGVLLSSAHAICRCKLS